MTQFLSGHGCFREYLYKYKHVDDPYCPHCEGKIQNAEHVLMECRMYTTAKNILEREIGGQVTPRGLITFMLTTNEAWNTANEIITSMMQQLRLEERAAARNENPTNTGR